MRIISGKHKGRRFFASKKLPVRPTTDQVKESLFNILANDYDFSQLSVLDLFSGTGNITFEFLSRGTTDITAVDRYFECLRFIRKTSKTLDTKVNTIKSDVFSFLKHQGKEYDLIFADPPYDFSKEQFQELVCLLLKNNHLAQDGVLIVEHSKFTNLSELPHFLKKRTYGGTHLSFFEYSG